MCKVYITCRGHFILLYSFLSNFLVFPQEIERAEEVYKPLRILAKPRAKYTSVASDNGFCGKVRLRVVFQANNEIGEVFVISGLPFGLTEQAIMAAKEIKFEPATWHNTPIRRAGRDSPRGWIPPRSVRFSGPASRASQPRMCTPLRAYSRGTYSRHRRC